MSRVFFISIKPFLDIEASLSAEVAYGRLGQNTGNLLFTNAVWSQLDYTTTASGYTFDPTYVNSNFDHVVIPAANWLYEGFDFTDLAALVEQLTIPTVFIGLGAQSGSASEIPSLKNSTVRLIKAVSELSHSIGVRGNFTAEVLSHYGITNVGVIGCPSLYFDTKYHLKHDKHNLDKIMLGGTRYYLSAQDSTPAGLAQQAIYRLAAKEGIDINFQSERPEFDYLLQGNSRNIEEQLLSNISDYYGVSSVDDMLKFLNAHGKIYTNVEAWIDEMAGYDFYLGSRIHGVIASLLAGTPACLFTHDSRTKELADFAAIPSLTIDKALDITMEDIVEVYEGLDLTRFEKSVSVARKKYIEFLNSNGLPHCLSS